MKQKTKRRFYKPVLTFLCAVAVLFAFTTCSDPSTGPYVMTGTALLNSITIKNVTVPNLTGIGIRTLIPAPIHMLDYDDWDYDLFNAPFEVMSFQLDSDIVNVRIQANSSFRAKVEWGIGDQATRPAAYVDVRVPATFYANDFVYIKVTAENSLLTYYYRFNARVFSAGTNLADVVVDGKSMDVKEGLEDWRGPFPATQVGDIALTRLQSVRLGGLGVRAVGFSETSTYRFARHTELETLMPGFVPNFRILGTITVQEGEVQLGEVPKLDDDGNPELDDEDNMIMIPNMIENWVTYSIMPEGFADQNILYIEVTAQNGIDRAYYKFLVSVARIANITKLSFVDGSKEHEVVGKGVPNREWSDVRSGTFAIAAMNQPSGGFTLNIVKEDPASIVQWDYLSTIAGTEPSYSNPTKMEFDDVKALVIKVTSESGLGINYYKIRVNILAANIIVQPKSEYYYYWDNAWNQTFDGFFNITRDDDGIEVSRTYIGPVVGDYDSVDSAHKTTIASLSVILDPPDEGQYDYQWYEANSWYGGYGFDVDGRTTKANGTKEGIPDPAFKADSDHSVIFDEKMNVSLFNGGNQKAQYVVPGRAIDGTLGSDFNTGGGETYTPKTAFKPFLPGFSTETHYYWVVITDRNTSYTVTSARAAIVSERDPRKKHYIIDVNNYWKPGKEPVISGKTATADLANKISFKNGQPFQKKYDKYRIPLTFPVTFKILDYSIMTAQAKFYLVDGTDWVQNWTNGNLSFENNDPKKEIADYGGGGTILVLYYNLTNNNATYMMDGDSKEPLGADLRTIPTHAVIEPSGDHTKAGKGNVGKNGYPPLGPDGKARSDIVSGGDNGDLQGWFCGFVELVELRFEGPVRSE
jgi:hypothetical protein